MSFIDNIRKKIAAYNLRKRFSSFSRERADLNFTKAKNVALLFDASSLEHVEYVKKYVAHLKDQKKIVRAIGYVNQNDFTPIILPKPEFEIFCLREVNFDYSPKTRWRDDFLDLPFDLLINCDLSDKFPVTYIASLSKAKFKIGIVADGSDEVYDLMLDVSKDKSIKYFLKNVDHYLHIINTTKDEK